MHIVDDIPRSFIKYLYTRILHLIAEIQLHWSTMLRFLHMCIKLSGDKVESKGEI